MTDDRPRFRRADRLSPWRRLAVHVWRSPADPTVYGVLEVDMRRTLSYLDAINRTAARSAVSESSAGKADWPAHASETSAVRVTATHLVIKAIAKALAETPAANAMIALGTVYVRDSIDVYCQVATDGGRDLSGVKIRHADRKSPLEIAEELSRAASSVRSGSDPGSEATKKALGRVPDWLLRPLLRLTSFLTFDLRMDLSSFGIAYDQFGGAMVSSVGGFGLQNGLAPLVPISRSPIVLLVGEVRERPLAENGTVIAAPLMNIGATFDHRLIDGYQAAAMARTVIESIRDPERAFGTVAERDVCQDAISEPLRAPSRSS